MSLKNVNLRKIKSIKLHKFPINKISIFPSGNLISVSFDKSIKIFDDQFNILQHIKNAHNDIISYVDIKDENNFVTCSEDKNIISWIYKENQFKLNIIIKNAHNNIIIKVIYYSNNNLISCSHDNTIKIWEEYNNKYQNISILIHFSTIWSILLIEDKNILVSAGENRIKFWNLNNFEIKINFKENYCGNWNGISRIDNDKIIFETLNEHQIYVLKIISIIKKIVIKIIIVPFQCFDIYLIEESQIFLVGGNSNDIIIYNKENYEYIQTVKSNHDYYINGFIQLKNEKILSYGGEGIINIWSFKN
jgi:hypothetical protein